MADIQVLIDYLQAAVPDAYARLVGAAPEQITALTDLLGYPLPPVYAGFLEMFGLNDGDLFADEGATTHIEAVIGYYRGLRAQYPEANFEACTVFAVGEDFEGFALLNDGSADPPVTMPENGMPVLFPADLIDKATFREAFGRGLVAERFTGFLLIKAFMLEAGRLGGKAHCVVDTDTTAASNCAVEAARKAGFEPETFSDRGFLCARHPEALLSGHLGLRKSAFGVSAKDAPTAVRLRDHFAAEIARTGLEVGI